MPDISRAFYFLLIISRSITWCSPFAITALSRHCHKLLRWSTSCKKKGSEWVLLCEWYYPLHTWASERILKGHIYWHRCPSWGWGRGSFLFDKSRYDFIISLIWRWFLPRLWQYWFFRGGPWQVLCPKCPIENRNEWRMLHLAF